MSGAGQPGPLCLALAADAEHELSWVSMPTRLLQASAEVFVDEWAGRHQSRSDKSDSASPIPKSRQIGLSRSPSA